MLHDEKCPECGLFIKTTGHAAGCSQNPGNEVMPEFDENPEYGGLINFASNGVVDIDSAFAYGFRLGWQTLYFEISAKIKK